MPTIAGIRGWIIIYLKGLCMGAADTVPGVSGGTIALILGIYERLIAALTSIDLTALGYVRSIHTREGRIELASSLQSMDAPFLFVLGAGILSAAVTIASVMNVAVRQHPIPTYAFFFGLIAASAIILYRHVDLGSPGRIGVGIVGVVFAFILTGMTAEAGPDPQPLVLFLTGAIAISAMVLPGISGAFILLILGQYEFISGIPRQLGEAILGYGQGGEIEPIIGSLIPFGTFLGGAIIGLFTIAYIVRAALTRYREATLVLLVSLMVGALRYPVEVVGMEIESLTFGTLLTISLAVIIGVLLIAILDRYTDDLSY